MPKALIFDFGNVLMHTVDYNPRHRWDTLLHVSQGTVERAVHNTESWLQAQRGEISIVAYWQDVAHRLNLTQGQVQSLATDFYAGDRLDDSLLSAIRDWHKQGVTIGLLSNDSVELRPKLQQLGIDTLFNPLIISAEIGVMKPALAAYHAVLNALPHYSPEDVVFIDDRLDNVQGAQAVGMTAIHYSVGTDVFVLIKQLTQLVDASLDKLI
jgi:putative hydrolase of the HAD superfamily